MKQEDRICPDDNWDTASDDPDPRAVRWATRITERLFSPDWSKWHYTEGNGVFTACGKPVIAFQVDGSPQERDVHRVDCRRCLSKMKVLALGGDE